jgi:hypothetical protein
MRDASVSRRDLSCAEYLRRFLSRTRRGDIAGTLL